MSYEENENNSMNEQSTFENGQSTSNVPTYESEQSTDNGQKVETEQNFVGAEYSENSGEQTGYYQQGSMKQEGYYQQNSYQQNDNQQNNYQQNNTNQNSYYQQRQNTSYQQNGSGNNDPKKNNKKGLAIAAVVLGIIFLFSSIAVTVVSVSNSLNKQNNFLSESETKETAEKKYEDIGSTSISSADTNTTTNSKVSVTDVSEVVEAAMPSVVAITSTTLMEDTQSYFDDIFGGYFGYGGGSNGGNGSRQYEQKAAGSGIIVDQTDTELLLITNNHVVEGADSLKIQFNGSEKNIDGYTKGTDAGADIAVVAVKLKDIPSDVMKNIKKATIGDSDSVKVGEGVIAIGNALGYGQSVTTGVISAKDREVSLENNTMKLLQTDAAINGGNSGGALINAKGEVIGVNVAKYSSSGYDTSSIEGMGFAIPITSVKTIISELEKRETRTKVSEKERGYMGITPYDVTDDVAEQYSMPKGVYVNDVSKGGPADKAGIQVSDIIVKFDGQSVSSYSTLSSIMDYYKAGEEVTVTIAYRDGREYTQKDVKLTLTTKDKVSMNRTNN